MKLHIIVVSFFQAWMNLLRIGQFHLFKIFQLPISNFKKTIPFADLHLHVIHSGMLVVQNVEN